MAEIKQVLIPDIGDFKNIPVVELLVKLGDEIKKEDPLISLESDKATMEIPSPFGGVIKKINVQEGDRVSEGAAILEIEVINEDTLTLASSMNQSSPSITHVETDSRLNQATNMMQTAPSATNVETISSLNQSTSMMPIAPSIMAHASPSIRRFARELGVNINLVSGSGKKKRILKDDIKSYIKDEMSKLSVSKNNFELDLLPWPDIEFSKFGSVELKPLSRIQKMSGANLHRNWVMIPHVTQFDEADITELEVERKKFNTKKQKNKIKLTVLAFLMHAVILALKEFPSFNSSLDKKNGDINLVIKNYYHIGFAVDTPKGLVVPVVRDANKKDIVTIAKEMGDLAERARAGKLKLSEMQGASFTISSLGGIGGTAFTPIINAPEVAILGVSRANIKPIYCDGQFVPRLMLPLSLSYDHRVIDGASAARFNKYLVKALANIPQAHV